MMTMTVLDGKRAAYWRAAAVWTNSKRCSKETPTTQRVNPLPPTLLALARKQPSKRLRRQEPLALPAVTVVRLRHPFRRPKKEAQQLHQQEGSNSHRHCCRAGKSPTAGRNSNNNQQHQQDRRRWLRRRGGKPLRKWLVLPPLASPPAKPLLCPLRRNSRLRTAVTARRGRRRARAAVRVRLPGAVVVLVGPAAVRGVVVLAAAARRRVVHRN